MNKHAIIIAARIGVLVALNGNGPLYDKDGMPSGIRKAGTISEEDSRMVGPAAS
jgi:hypothetical protein